jgi:hypothetical protein
LGRKIFFGCLELQTALTWPYRKHNLHLISCVQYAIRCKGDRQRKQGLDWLFRI